MQRARLLGIAMVLVAAVGFGVDARAWSGHGRLSEIMLSSLPEVQKLATYEPIAQLIPRLGLRLGKRDVLTEEDLTLYLRIKRDSATRKGYRFRPLAGEKPDQTIPILKVFAAYADEPDGWQFDGAGNEPDTFLFDDDQYGDELWRPEYEAMGSRRSTSSQAFRHMFWGKLDIWNLITTFKFPLSQLLSEMGVADERARAYVELSRKAKAAGSTYWQARFLANALHYLQDCSQPFHVAQTPSKEMIGVADDHAYPNAPSRPLPGTLVSLLYCGTFGSGTEKCVQYMSALTNRTTNVVAYYHFSYERFIDAVITGEAGLPEVQAELTQALLNSASEPDLNYSDRDPSRAVRAMAATSVDRAAQAARSAMDFFPGLGGLDLGAIDPASQINEAWWKSVKQTAEDPNHPARRAYFANVAESFAVMGQSVRAVVAAELSGN